MILLMWTLAVALAVLCAAVIWAGMYLNVPIQQGEIPIKTRGYFPYDSRYQLRTDLGVHMPVTRQADRDPPKLTDVVIPTHLIDQEAVKQWLH